MRTGERINLSTFGAVGDESKVGTLYPTIERQACSVCNLGGNADSFRPMVFGMEGFFILIPISAAAGKAVVAYIIILRRKIV